MPRKDTRPRFRAVDEKTGEMGPTLVIEGRRRGGPAKQRTGGNWVRLYPEELWRLTSLSANERRVLDWLIQNMGWNVPFRFRVIDIAADLNMRATHVSSYLRTLRDIGILVEEGRRAFWLNPRLFWLGTDEQREETITALSSTLDTTTPAPEGPAS
jgi:hypothetical protein